MIRVRTQELPEIGTVTVAVGPSGVRALSLGDPAEVRAALARQWPEETVVEDAEAGATVLAEVAEYLAGRRTTFTQPLELRGTEFQRAVWAAVAQIPYGETRSYGELAAALGRPGAARAVGAANRANPVCILVPCHRVVGANGALVGYAYGLPVKERLLTLEGGLADRLYYA